MHIPLEYKPNEGEKLICFFHVYIPAVIEVPGPYLFVYSINLNWMDNTHFIVLLF